MAEQSNPDATEPKRPDTEPQPGEAGQSTPSMQSEEERAGVTPPPQTAADEMD